MIEIILPSRLSNSLNESELNLLLFRDYERIKEQLTRMGFYDKKYNTLYQSTNIFRKKNKYYIVHFKEMLAINGRVTNYNSFDESIRNLIAGYLQQWGLIYIKGGTLRKICLDALKTKKNSHYLSILPKTKVIDTRLVQKYKFKRG